MRLMRKLTVIMNGYNSTINSVYRIEKSLGGNTEDYDNGKWVKYEIEWCFFAPFSFFDD